MEEAVKGYTDLVNAYVKPEEWKLQGANKSAYSIGGLILSNSAAITEEYWLSEVYDPEVAEAHRSGLIHIHDLDMLTGRSAGWSLRQLITDGLGGVPGKVSFGPARHLSVLCNQMVNFLGIMQNEWSGAMSFSSFDTYLAPFVKADGLNYRQVRQSIESFVLGVNMPIRWGTQPPFSNITLDWTVPPDLAGEAAIVGGEEMDFTYGDCQAEMDMINQAFLEIMIAGDSEGGIFRYPIPTYSVTENFGWTDSDNNRLLFELTAKYGMPYFANHIFSDRLQEDARRFETDGQRPGDVLRKKSGGYFGYGEQSGSIGAVTINLPRIAYLSADESEFYHRLDEAMALAARSLKTKRSLLTRMLNGGLYPYTRRYMGTYDRHVSSIGPVGINEACLNASWLRRDLWNPAAQRFSLEILQHMKDSLLSFQEHYGDLHELEATPAESAAFILAKKDRERYPEIVTAGKPGDTPYYTASSQLPSDATTNVQEALGIQDELQSMYTGGTAFHIYLTEQMPGWKDAAGLVRHVTENYELPYFTISPIFSMCPGHGYLKGTVYECPVCGQKTEVFCRIAGYYHPMDEWNDGKIQEFKNRRNFLLHARSSESLIDVREDIAIQLKEDALVQSEGLGMQIEGDIALGPFREPEAAPKKELVRTEEEEDGQLRFADMVFESGSGREEAEPEDVPKDSGVPENQMKLDFSAGGWKRPESHAKKNNPGGLENGLYLFTVPNDPNCMYARELLKGESCTEYSAPEEIQMITELGIVQAPTLLQVQDGQMVRLTGIYEINTWLEKRTSGV